MLEQDERRQPYKDRCLNTSVEQSATINKDSTFIMSKYYISQTFVEYIDDRLNFREVVLTRADARADKDGARYKNVKMFMHKLRALGIENLHINEYEKKRYNRLVREQNKRHKEKYKRTKALTAADIVKMTEQFDSETQTKE